MPKKRGKKPAPVRPLSSAPASPAANMHPPLLRSPWLAMAFGAILVGGWAAWAIGLKYGLFWAVVATLVGAAFGTLRGLDALLPAPREFISHRPAGSRLGPFGQTLAWAALAIVAPLMALTLWGTQNTTFVRRPTGQVDVQRESTSWGGLARHAWQAPAVYNAEDLGRRGEIVLYHSREQNGLEFLNGYDPAQVVPEIKAFLASDRPELKLAPRPWWLVPLCFLAFGVLASWLAWQSGQSAVAKLRVRLELNRTGATPINS